MCTTKHVIFQRVYIENRLCIKPSSSQYEMFFKAPRIYPIILIRRLMELSENAYVSDRLKIWGMSTKELGSGGESPNEEVTFLRCKIFLDENFQISCGCNSFLDENFQTFLTCDSQWVSQLNVFSNCIG